MSSQLKNSDIGQCKITEIEEVDKSRSGVIINDNSYARLEPLMLEHWKQPMSATRCFGIMRRSKRTRKEEKRLGGR